jgi:hypothetical protein
MRNELELVQNLFQVSGKIITTVVNPYQKLQRHNERLAPTSSRRSFHIHSCGAYGHCFLFLQTMDSTTPDSLLT